MKNLIRSSSQIRRDFLDFFQSKQHALVSSSSLLPDSPNLLFTNAGMNQFVPIFIGDRKCPYQPPRAADTQKCIRAGGKHNDLEDVGLDTYHHTFFEMLGNWSFGDYFKKEAIDWAWELVTGVWQFPTQRLYATVYNPDAAQGDPSEFDQEAYDCWAEKFSRLGLDPKIHIRNGNKKDNFWMMGETGPCGPCSELHMDLTPDGSTRGALVNQGSPQCIEIWNLVFMQFNANPDGTFGPLPARNVDTGMGFERVASILQCTKNFTDFYSVISNYETDVFRPIFDRLEQLSGRRYHSSLPRPGSTSFTETEKVDIAFRVISDHIRTLSFAIADGILPGNTDRNYVLRRILRRAVRYGRTLGFHEPFFYKLVEVLAETMGPVFPEIRSRQELVKTTIRTEEESFNRTLDRGIELFREEVNSLGTQKQLSGDFAFKLYDTYGFPLDLTQLMAREAGMVVDQNGFDRLMDEQKDRAKAAQKKTIVTVTSAATEIPTRFLGFESLQISAKVLAVSDQKGKEAVIVDASPCYAEMGGQVGDTGLLASRSDQGEKLWRILNTQKAGDVFLHLVQGEDLPAIGAEVEIRVDEARRKAIQRHHTATHLLHWALHEAVSQEATQKGSFVSPDKFTFDFNGAPLTPAQVAEVERLVNERILDNAPVAGCDLPYDEVKGHPGIMQIFGEKYGEVVRVVQIGGQPGQLNGYSMELCGGTHARATGEIGLFRIVGENAIAAGVRRIEAIAGLGAYQKSRQETEVILSLAGKVNSPVADLEKKVEALLAHQKELEKQIKAMRQREACETARGLAGQAETIGATPAILRNLGEVDGDFLQMVLDVLKAEFKGVAVLFGASGGNVALVAAVAPEWVKQFQAGKIIQNLAPIVGGKGGGKPDFARGGGKDAAKITEALAKARALLA